MKKRKLFILLAVINLLSCMQNPGDENNSSQKTKKPPIILTIDISKHPIDISEHKGKKAFLVAVNQAGENWSRVNKNTSSSSENIIPFIKSENQYVNVPYNPPQIDFPLIEISQPLISRNIMKTETVSEPDVGSTRDFYAFDSNDKSNSEYAKGCVLKAKGKHCYVWYKEKVGITVDDNSLQSLADTFDSIYEKETFIFGKNTLTKNTYSNIIDLTDENMKINIIVYDLFNDLETTIKNQGGVFGYFSSVDFYSTEDVTFNDGKTLKSNRCECIHIDSYFLQVAKKAQQSTIAHEFQHLLHYVNKSLNPDSNKTSETWFNEMMSMVCEDIMQSQLKLPDVASPKSRLSLFNMYHLEGFSNWLSGNGVYISYANAYAFGAYLLRNYGIDFIKELATNNYVDEEAITNALIKCGAKEKNFTEVLNQYYNVILNPTATEYTLNKSVSKTYKIAEEQVTFNCGAIDLSKYVTISKVSEKDSNKYYKAKSNENYYGPLILNKLIYTEMGGYGMYASYFGIVGYDLGTKVTFSSDVYGTNPNIKYRLVFFEQ